MKGILFIEPLYHKVVTGEKTMTRRAGKGLDEVNKNPEKWVMVTLKNEYNKPDGKLYAYFRSADIHDGLIQYPRYNVGEIVYLKEPVNLFAVFKSGEKRMEPVNTPIYKYDNNPNHLGITWSNKLFMGEQYARAFIRITGVKCERLMDISDHDCLAEGIETVAPGWYKNYTPGNNAALPYPFQSFISLYRFANKIKPNVEIPNIFCWAYTFEYLPNHINQ